MQTRLYTLPEKLTEIAKKCPDKIALQIKKSEGYEKYTYQDLHNNAQAIMQSLFGLGIQKNDRIIIVLENRPEWGSIYFGILFTGAIAVPLDPQSTIDDFKYFLENSEGKVVFTSANYATTISKAAQTIPNPPKIVLLAEEKLTDQFLLFSDFLNISAQPPADLKTQAADVASILYTSGTTGKPKGVMLTHENFYSNFCSIKKSKIFDSVHNFLAVLPLHHTFPFMATLLVPLFSQNQITFVTSPKREELMKCMQETGVTIFVGVPQFFYLFHQTILNEINKIPFFLRLALLGLVKLLHNFRQLTNININKILLAKIHKNFGTHLKFFASGGARLDKNVELFLNQIGFTILQGYGLTETSPVVTFNPIEKQKIGSAGKAIPDVNIKIIEPDIYNIGEIAIHGPNLMLGYYKHEQETQEVLKNNWFYSGDLGYIDPQGYLFITGRKKELIKLSSGKNISPEEVETHYLKSNFIKELCVLSTGKDEKEKLTAVIVPDFEYFKNAGEIDIYNVIKLELEILSNNYPLYKCIVGFIITKDVLPRTNLGKLKRHEIASKYTDELMGKKTKTSTEEATSSEDLAIISSQIYQTIATVITQIKHLKTPIHLNDHLGIDLAFDSLGRVELMATMEKQFNINIPESLITHIATIGDLALIIDKMVIEQKSQTSGTICQAKKNLWQDILLTDPATTIVEKLDLAPSGLAKIFYASFCNLFYIISKLMWRLKIVGAENLPQNKPFILCPNHASYLDAFLVLASIPKWLQPNIFFLGFHTYFNVPVVRNYVKMERIIPIDYTTNLVDAMRACGYVLRNNKTTCIFPEGGRSPDGSVQPFKKGVGILAHELQIPLVPVYIAGAFAALPRGKTLPRFNQIQITFGKPQTPEQLLAKGLTLGITDEYEAIAKALEEEVTKLKAYFS